MRYRNLAASGPPRYPAAEYGKFRILYVSREMKTALQVVLFIAAAMNCGCQSQQSLTPRNTMNEATVWNDGSRTELRETLRTTVLGEVRLAKSSHDEIIDTCRVVYIDEESPEQEREQFVRFATEELGNAATNHTKEQINWPRETDCDRLDRVDTALRDNGILLWQASPCCDTCTVGELPDRIEAIDRRHPGFSNRLRGYAFFIDQNMADMLAEDTNISVYLAYGWYSEDGSSVSPELYERNALGIAREVCECLQENGFEPNWDGSFSKKIGISLNWQRRTMLE